MTSPIFSLKTLAVAITSISVAGVASAAGLDRSGQDVSAFLQDGTYAELSYTYIDADVTGHDNAVSDPKTPKKFQQGNKIDDIAEPYSFIRYGVKADINDTFSVGVLYDEPFGAAAAYSGKNNFVSPSQAVAQGAQAKAEAELKQAVIASMGAGKNPATDPNVTLAVGKVAATEGLIASAGESTEVEVHSQNITALLGAKIGNNFQVYGGPALQRIEGEVALRGSAYSAAAGYDARISPDEALGWVAGAAFMKPEIGLKAALTYRSEIEHNNTIAEAMPGIGVFNQYTSDKILASVYAGTKQKFESNINKDKLNSIKITTPESFNLDFQTGLNPTTLATAKVRYVPWSKFEIVPPLYNGASKVAYGPNGLPLVGYSEDQWQVEIGVAKRLTPALAVSGAVGWDSGAGSPTTSLGPVKGYYSVGAGAKYNITPNWAVSAGGKYLMFGDAEGVVPTGQVVSEFKDNTGYIVGVKLSYQDK